MRRDILEEFADSALLGDRNWLELSVRFLWNQELPDEADRFLQATEEEREAMRRVPRVIPKVDWDVRPVEEKRYGIITLTDAIHIRKSVSKGIPMREMARRYHVAPITIQRIINGRTFRPDRKWPSPNELRIARANGRVGTGT